MSFQQKKQELYFQNKYHNKDGVFNVSRCALLIAAFTKNNLDLVKVACKDKFHQDYRSHLINNYDDIVKYANKLDSLGTFLSGAGPTIMTIAKDSDDKILDQMNLIYLL